MFRCMNIYLASSRLPCGRRNLAAAVDDKNQEMGNGEKKADAGAC